MTDRYPEELEYRGKRYVFDVVRQIQTGDVYLTAYDNLVTAVRVSLGSGPRVRAVYVEAPVEVVMQANHNSVAYPQEVEFEGKRYVFDGVRDILVGEVFQSILASETLLRRAEMCMPGKVMRRAAYVEASPQASVQTSDSPNAYPEDIEHEGKTLIFDGVRQIQMGEVYLSYRTTGEYIVLTKPSTTFLMVRPAYVEAPSSQVPQAGEAWRTRESGWYAVKPSQGHPDDEYGWRCMLFNRAWAVLNDGHEGWEGPWGWFDDEHSEHIGPMVMNIDGDIPNPSATPRPERRLDKPERRRLDLSK